MLDNQMKQQLKEYFTKLEHGVVLEVQNGDHGQRAELTGMLGDIASLSDKIEMRESDFGGRDALSFRVLNESGATGIVFSGIPGGHEFSSLILAVLQAGGSPLKLDQGVQALVAGLDEPLHFRTVVSLSCHNCPDVVQALNAFALLNPNVTHEMIDGALYQDFVDRNKIQGVPAVFLNDEPFANGKIDTGGIIEKILERGPVVKKTSSGTDENSAGEPYDMAIVGGGPGGIAAAVYGARKGLRIAMVADRVGGQVRDTMDIENLIALPKTTGPELSNTLAEQLRSHGIDLKEHLRVNQIEDGPLKRVELNTGEVLQAKTVLIATGAKWRELGVPGEKENIGNGVAYCPHCDGPFFKDKDVAVIGGGNSGVEAALDLSGIVRSVKLMEFGPKLNADQVLVERVERTPNIRVITDARTTEVRAENGKVKALDYEGREDGRAHSLELDGVFVQIGLLPNSAFVSDLLKTNPMGEIEVDEKCRTNVPGIFACGDVTNTPYKQIVIAMGEGAKACLSAFEYLMKLPEESAPAKREPVAV